MSKAYYETLRLYGDRSVTTVTFLEGENAGKKQIFCGEKQVYSQIERAVVKENWWNLPPGVIDGPSGTAFVEHLGQAPVCVICGAGHVGIPVIKMAKLIGFEVVVIEDRPVFADKARNAGAARVFCDSFECALKQMEERQQVYFVVMTRGHRYDEECLSVILKKSYAYVGMMASRGRAARMKQNLIEKGFSEEAVSQIHMPIGLSIHARTSEEIGLSVVAQLISVKNGADSKNVYDWEILDSVINKSKKEPWILATIIKRQGSAPREIGTKMLITDMGTTVGTIGGGCMEAQVIREAMSFLRRRTENMENPMKILTIDLSGVDAENSGMVCGGRMEVLLEVVN